MRRVLVTGGAGYIGSHICKSLADKGIESVAYDDLSAGSREAVQWSELVVGDVRNADHLFKVLKQYSISEVIHCAALTSVRDSFNHVREYWSVNVAGTYQLLAAMDMACITSLVFSSSCSVYGQPSHMPIQTTQSLNPISPYGYSKLAAEQALWSWSMSRQLQYVSLRYFNVAGTCSSGSLGYHLLREDRIIPTILRSINERKQPKFKLFGIDHKTRDGTCIRDYIHVSDLAEAHIGALEFIARSDDSVTMNLGSGGGTTVQEVINACEQETQCKIDVVVLPKRNGEPSELICDSEGSWQILGSEPERASINTMIKDSWNWIRRNS